MRKYWEETNKIHKLHYCESGEDEIVAVIKEKNGKLYCTANDLSMVDHILLYDISKAKQKIEEMLIQTWEKELDMLNAFLN